MVSTLKDSKSKGYSIWALTFDNCTDEDVKDGMIEVLAAVVLMILLLLELKVELKPKIRSTFPEGTHTHRMEFEKRRKKS